MRMYSSFLLAATLLVLTACGSSSDRPVYSGHEESTAGVPGWTPNGQRKLHPNIKLGQSYRVSGKTYVPRYQPDYAEEGMASWYGPGFHGLKTANGERYNMGDHTAAHTTLPLPSIVKVTYLKTGRSAYARVNDRGPFAHNRIIDVSKAVAEDIGLIRDGVGKVRVEYLPMESERFIDLMIAGRDPQSIDLASEVIGQAPNGSAVQYANVAPADESVTITEAPAPGVWEQINPIASAEAAVPVQPPVVIVTEPMPPATLPVPVAQAEPLVILPTGPPVVVMTPQVAPAVVVESAPYVQLGAFSNQTNALSMQQRFTDLGATSIAPGSVNGAPVYRVRLGPFVNEEAALEILERAQQMGVGDAKLITATH